MFSKPLRLLLILGGCLSVAVVGGCLTGTGSSAGGGAARSIFAGGSGDGPGASSFAGPSSVGSGSSDEGAGGGGAANDPGTTSDSPITVVGTPLGSSQGPHCAPSGTRLYFDEVSLAITGQTDELGRREILVRSGIHTQHLSDPPEGFGGSVVSFVNPDDSTQGYGTTAPFDSCVFAKLYAPPEAAGKIVRLTASMLVCASNPMGDALGAQEASSFAALTFGPTTATAFVDFAIPEKTDETTLVDCGPATDVRSQILNDHLSDELLQRRIEAHTPSDSGASDGTRFGRDLIQRPAF